MSDPVTRPFEAFNELQAALPRVGKDAQGDGYRFLSLPHLLSQVQPVLWDHGFTLVETLRGRKDGGVEVFADLHYGEQLVGRSSLVAPRPTSGPRGSGKEQLHGDLQALGTTVTYLRRYVIQTVLGIAPDRDTDGAGVGFAPKPEPDHVHPTEAEKGSEDEQQRNPIYSMVLRYKEEMRGFQMKHDRRSVARRAMEQLKSFDPTPEQRKQIRAELKEIVDEGADPASEVPW